MTESGTPESAVGDDPDAPWRPGYTGPEPTPLPASWAQPTTAPAPPPGPAPLDPWSREADEVIDEQDDPTGSGGDRPPIDPEEAERARRLAIEEAPASDGVGLVGVVGMLVVIGLVVAGLVAVGLLNDGDEEVSALPVIPETVDERWSTDTADALEVLIVGDAVIARTVDELIAFDADTGEELWARPSADEAARIEIQAVGGVLLFLDRSADSLVATGVDPMTGDDVWNRNVAERREIFELRDRLVEYEFEQETQSGRFAILSPDTGLPTGERLRVTDVSTSPPFISASTVDDDETVLLDIDTDERIAVPFESDDLAALTVAGDRLLALTDEGSLVLYDELGEIVDEIDATLGPDQRAPENLFSVPGERAVVLSTDGSSVGVAIDGDELDITWSAEGVVQLLERTDSGPLAILAPDERRPDRSLIVDPLGGETLFVVETMEQLAFGYESQSFGRNGLVYVDDGTLIGLDLDGEELWTLDELGSFALGDGLVVEYDDDGITAYG